MNPQPPDSFRLLRNRKHIPPFWQADKPYLHEHNINDARFRLLGYLMALLAGAINAGGFFAVVRYTSHVTGEMSYMADMAYLGQWKPALIAFFGTVCFLMGATHSSWVILWAKRHRFRGGFGFSMWLEAIYLLLFGLVATLFGSGGKLPAAAMFLLCFIMGMHNTVMTILSGGAIRSTHMTGTVTDLGIEISKMLYYRRSNNPKLPHIYINKPKTELLLGLWAAFLTGGLIGAWGYHNTGHYFALPVAAALFVFGFGSVGYDIRLRLRRYLQKK